MSLFALGFRSQETVPVSLGIRRAANLKLLEATDAAENVLPNMIYRKEREASAVSVARAQKTKPAVQLIALKIAMLFC